MCRFLAYSGLPVFLEDFVASPCHSLIHQSLHAEEAKTGTNGDGFGVGWYGDRPEPGQYREVRPAWSDENLLSIARQVRSHLFFAHVRAATGTATTRANCHPFVHGRYMFMHNGQIGGYGGIRRKLEALIPDSLYAARAGTTDSEALFLLALAHLEQGFTPGEALAAAIGDALSLMLLSGTREPLRCAAALADGETIHAVRWSSDAKPPSLYLCEKPDSIVVASEPVDAARECWHALPCNTLATVSAGRVTLTPLTIALNEAA
ncbi:MULTISPECIES: class II glutamine amidotransferase [unclassified Bosea (in: a-proteobacteria)]|uniref:class II glutamine amidotransferase n=1 Tax=unclassified Bosea (in: a-proteobacteria) TaxID=2653178 RepID=UPI0009567D79|nr:MULTISPECIES: class II glutamine amidotransferase [unclassified Bosea (in: a-proteobacteria)]TAJ34499.1 MAG: class II glutamine amidotransferase [Bosea sp. (in: a-proteobacteria)]SIQ88441.1 glutamine amidotransferase [Bosea sp. TND4EK4]